VKFASPDPAAATPSRLLPTRRWSPRTGLALLRELGTVTFRYEPRRSRRPCHPRAISSGRERQPADTHGHSEKATGLAARS
jgi:hypothetical protein